MSNNPKVKKTKAWKVKAYALMSWEPNRKKYELPLFGCLDYHGYPIFEKRKDAEKHLCEYGKIVPVYIIHMPKSNGK